MEEINLKELFLYFKNKLIGIIIAVIVIVASLNIYTYITREPLFQSDTTVALVASSGKDISSADVLLNQNLIGTYTEIIKSRKVIEQVISNLSLEYSYKELLEMVSVKAIDETDIIKITVESTDNKEARKIADEIAKVFTEEVQNVYNLENVYILDKASKSNKPYNVNYIKDNAIYLVISLVISLGVVFVIFYFDNTIKTTDNFEELYELPLLGVVPLSGGKK